MMEFLELISQRQSVRRYAKKSVEKEKLDHCLEAARLSPSASNGQPWTFIVVDDPGMCRKVALETFSPVAQFNKFALEAPVIIVIVIERMRIITQIGALLKQREFSLIDIGIAAEHFCLQAAAEGLGTCMLGWFNEKPIKKLLNIPARKRIGLLITLGYPKEDYPLREKKRKNPDEFARKNKY